MDRNVVSLKYKQKLCGFPKVKNSNRSKALICAFQKNLLKVIQK